MRRLQLYREKIMSKNREILYWSVTGVGTAIAATSSKENAIKFAAIAVVNRLLEFSKQYEPPILQTCRQQAMLVGAVTYVAPTLITFLKDKSPLSAFMCTVAGSAIAHSVFGNLQNMLLNGTKITETPKRTMFAVMGQFSKFYNNDGTALGLFLAGSTRWLISTITYIDYQPQHQVLDSQDYRVRLDWLCKNGIQFMLYGVPSYLSSVSPQFSATYTSLGVIGKIATATLIECGQTNNLLRNAVKKCFDGASELSHGRSPF
jgi:hypothetical protein